MEIRCLLIVPAGTKQGNSNRWVHDEVSRTWYQVDAFAVRSVGVDVNQTDLVGEDGEVRRFVNVYVNQEDIRFLENQATSLKDGDDVSIIPAIAGG